MPEAIAPHRPLAVAGGDVARARGGVPPVFVEPDVRSDDLPSYFGGVLSDGLPASGLDRERLQKLREAGLDPRPEHGVFLANLEKGINGGHHVVQERSGRNDDEARGLRGIESVLASVVIAKEA